MIDNLHSGHKKRTQMAQITGIWRYYYTLQILHSQARADDAER